MSKPLRVPESCNQCRYNPFGGICMKHDCKNCEMGGNSFCKCLTVSKGTTCQYATYDKEDTCPICGEKYSYSENIYGGRRDSYRVMLSITDDTGYQNRRVSRSCLVCPTCGEQLKKCMEETHK